ncbi:hypothetical protein KAW80_04620 [Candidatus Babeliales bacterium]|nr:hypothetical protein [Candidatus Babeliales bacterium]
MYVRQRELLQHAQEELAHAQLLSDRIIQLGETPPLKPEDWPKFSNCKYLVPTDAYVKSILRQNIKSEQCAIDVYNNIMKFVSDKDMVTYHIAEQILQDELEHEEDLENILRDINLIGK